VDRPAPAHPETSGHPAQARFEHPLALFAVTAGIGIASAIAAGVVIGLIGTVVGSAGCSPNDGWCDLGAAVLGVLAGVAAAAVAYVVAGVLAIRRFRPPTRRAAPIALHVASLLLIPVLLAVANGVLG
jgi:hypothetical protein